MRTCNLGGIFAPVPTPFSVDGEIAWEHFVKNIIQFGKTSLDGIVVLGTNGEAVALREIEKVRLIALAREYFPAQKKVIAGVGCESLYATQALSQEAARVGADMVLVLNPTYYRSIVSRAEVMLNYFFHVADSAPVPMLLYNMPHNTGINIPASVMVRASYHGNIIGVKDSGGNIAQLAAVIKDSASNFAVFAGSASFLLPTLYMGGVGGTMACANIVPEHCTAIFRAFQAGEHNKARHLQMEILDLNRAVTTDFGIVGLKYALECLGYYGGPCRDPLPEKLSKEGKNVIQELMKKICLLV